MRRFTLVELAIAVTIICTLAALAIPQIADLQQRARKAELAVVVDGLDEAARGYLIDTGSRYRMTAYAPDAAPGRSARPWPGPPGLGFEPDGAVRGSYRLGTLHDPVCHPMPAAALLCADEGCTGGMVDLDQDLRRSCALIGVDGALQWHWPDEM